ncbi:ankyrin repeat-containing domain protein [Xylogone sp. PMI_703]|nr:ankyrin repeat-containing domain protein [Xylogone sp. PMI_703]
MSISTSTSPYRKFQRLESGQHGMMYDNGLNTLVAQNGAIFYETELREFLSTIIELDDVVTLNQYLAQFPGALEPGETYRIDPFWVAARHGSTNALRVLLEHYVADPTQTTVALDARGYLLLNVACGFAHINTARFLLDDKPAFANIHARDDEGVTALLAAASSLAHIHHDDVGQNSVHDYITRAEDLIRLLLDRGACARDVVPQSNKTVLSLAISRARPELVNRLIGEGADVHTKQMYINQAGPVGSLDPVWDVTPLHIASFYSNNDGIQILFDRRGNGINIADMVSCSDTLGRLPIHFAAAGSYVFEENHMLLETDFASRIFCTIKLLLTGNSNIINAQDKQGNTPLHYAVKSYIPYSNIHFKILQILCENGADASLRNGKGRTPLQYLASHVLAGRLLDTAFLDLLLAHGANVNDADADGNTLLHFIANNLNNAEAARLLLNRGADVTIRNSKGNTPLHEAAGENTRFKSMGIMVEDKIKAQDEMMNILREAAGKTDLMDQRNAAGRTPRQIHEEKKNKLLEDDKPMRQRLAGTGRGRALLQSLQA